MSAGSRFILPYQTVIDSTGVPLPGAFLYFYISGTATPLNTYSDQALTTPNKNPVPANSAGVFPNIFLEIDNYKVVLTDSLNNEIWTADPVLGGPPLGGQTATFTSAATVDLGYVTASVITISGTTTINSFGTSSLPGDIKVLLFSGILQLTQSAALLLPNGGSNITTAVGDRAIASCITSGNWEVIAYQKADGTALDSNPSIGAAQLLASAQGFNAPLNLRINATVSLNNLTVAIMTAANANPSASSPVLIPFRDPTLANGDPIIASLQAALSFTVAATNTMGTTNGAPFRLWAIAYYNAGTIAVGLFNASTATEIFGLPEGALVTTDVSTDGGSSAGTHYANVSAITSTPFRILGYLEWSAGLATAGSWASAPTSIVLFGPGIKKPGEMVQLISGTFNSTTAINGSNIDTGIKKSIAPTSTPNLIRAVAVIDYQQSGSNSNGTFSIGRTSAGQIVGTNIVTSAGATGSMDVGIPLMGLDAPGTVSSTTYTVYGSTSAGTNAMVGTQYLELQELMG